MGFLYDGAESLTGSEATEAAHGGEAKSVH
jgi:hypothetical protein